MMNKKLTRIIPFLSMLLLLTACPERVEKNLHRSMTVQSNAYYIAYKKPSEDWNVIYGNRDKIWTRTMQLESEHDAVEVIFVCPASVAEVPHRVYYYRVTTAELKFVTKLCTVDAALVKQVDVYGEVLGVDANNNERASISLVNDNSVDALEGYAVQVGRTRATDILAYMGEVQNTPLPNTITPKKFFIKYRDDDGVGFFNSDPARIDVNFSDTLIDGPNEEISYVSPDQLLQASVSLDADAIGRLWHSEVNFISVNGNRLALAASEGATSFPFYSVPEFRYTMVGGIPTITRVPFTKSNEGHELFVHVMKNGVASYNPNTLETDLDRMAVRFFHGSSAGSGISLSVPQAPSASASVTVNAVDSADGKTSNLNFSWPSYTDINYGNSKFHELVVNGDAASSLSEIAEVITSKVRWYVYVSPEAALPSGNGQRGISLPDNLLSLQNWQREWMFRGTYSVNPPSASNITLDMKSYVSNGETQGIADYLFKRLYTSDFTFAMVSRQAFTASQAYNSKVAK